MAAKSHNPAIRVIGVESSDGPAMQRSVQAGALETIDCRTIIDGLRVRRVGEINFSVVQRYVDEIVTLPDREIFDAVIWIMERCKLVVEGAAAAPVAALLHGLIKVPPGSRVVAVLSGGNLNLDQLRDAEMELTSQARLKPGPATSFPTDRAPPSLPARDAPLARGPSSGGSRSSVARSCGDGSRRSAGRPLASP